MANIKRFLVLPAVIALFALVVASPVHAQTIPVLSVTAYTQVQTSVPQGANNANFATLTLDARESSEDIEVRSLPVRVMLGNNADAADLDSCQVYNAANMSAALNTGTNVEDLEAGDNTLAFDTPLVVREGTVTTLWFQCDLSSSAAIGETFQMNIMPITAIDAVSSDSDEDIEFPSSSVVGTGSILTVVQAGTVVAPTIPVTPSFPNTGAGGNATNTIVFAGLSLAVLGLGVVGMKKYAR